MLKHYILISWRNIVRNKFYSVLLTLGLAVGIAASLMLGLYAYDELSYDNFHEKKDRIYLVGVDSKSDQEEGRTGWTTPPTGPALKEFYPEIEASARLCFWFEDVMVRRGERQHAEDHILGADSTVFDIFTIPFLKGNPKTALKEPNAVVITESTARKYFGDENPIGQTLNFETFFSECKVTGVVKDYPPNGHFTFDMLVSLSSFKSINFDFTDSWNNHTFSTYVLLNKNASIDQVESGLPKFVKAYYEPFLVKKFKKTYAETYAGTDRYAFFFMPLAEVHLSTMIFENQEGKQTLIYALIGIAAIILLLVCINYTNLATALSLQRTKEVGIRKVSGSRGVMLFKQFLTESVLVALIGLLVGIGLLELGLPLFNVVADKNIHLSYTNPVFVLGLVGFAVLLGVVSGIYPALTFASFNPIRALKGRVMIRGNHEWLRNGLVIFQFSICVAMVVCTLVAYRQLAYMTSRNLGFAKDHLVVLKRPQGLGENRQAFKNELLKQSGVLNVSFTNTTPGRHFDGHGQHFAGTDADDFYTVFPLVADADILETLSLKLVAGKGYTADGTEKSQAILNEAAVKALHLDDPLQTIIDNGTLGKKDVNVVGVVKDFHFKSFHHAIEPLVLYFPNGDMRKMENEATYILVKIEGSDVAGTLQGIEQTWKRLSNGYVFDYSFLDQDFNRLFAREQTTAKIYSAFSILAVLIASVGLLGLASFFTALRTKEIGVRKVLGASVLNIATLLSRDFVRWIVVAIVAGSAVSYYLVEQWLSNFAYRASLSWWIFALAGVAVLFITGLALSGHIIRAAKGNPTEALRSE
ncbi:ABC transporter permease [Chryseolinea lacunae]|uniref:ABC transporter permease n=1 Tax=Chryseolinea lacunae TaxID=2801331 RepID=A0ABS1KL21_9BACT|nr:ABC transporter permease [Chryseolinea lacunae]MBL0740045.1 ABC transporter permease [Chryseolinea lacunae]